MNEELSISTGEDKGSIEPQAQHWDNGFSNFASVAGQNGDGFSMNELIVSIRNRSDETERFLVTADNIRQTPYFRWRDLQPDIFRERMDSVLRHDVRLREQILGLHSLTSQRNSDGATEMIDAAILQTATAIVSLGEQYAPKVIAPQEQLSEESISANTLETATNALLISAAIGHYVTTQLYTQIRMLLGKLREMAKKLASKRMEEASSGHSPSTNGHSSGSKKQNEQQSSPEQPLVQRLTQATTDIRSSFQERWSSALQNVKKHLDWMMQTITTRPSPMVDHTYRAGIRRGDMDRKDDWLNRYGTLMHTEIHGDDDQFITIKRYNRYNPATGELSADAPSIPLEYSYETPNTIIKVPIKPSDIAITDSIALPRPIGQPVENPGGQVTLTSMLHSELVYCSVRDRRENVIMNKSEVLPLLTEDALGNITLHISEELHRRIAHQSATIECRYGRNYEKTEADWFHESNPSAIGAISDEQWELQKPLLPTRVITQVEAEPEDPETRGHTLTGFLRNHWLQYDHKDAPPQKRDPRAFTQTERVVEQRRSSCEGSNIAMLSLLRPKLTEDENLIFVTGIWAEGGRNRITNSQYHGSVIHLHRNDETTNAQLLDATPFSEKFAPMILARLQERRDMLRDWQHASKELLQKRKEEGRFVSDGSEESIEDWNDLFGRLDDVWDNKAVRTTGVFSEDQITTTPYYKIFVGNDSHLTRYLAQANSFQEIMDTKHIDGFDGQINFQPPEIDVHSPHLTPDMITNWSDGFSSSEFPWPKQLELLLTTLEQAQNASGQNREVVGALLASFEAETRYYTKKLKDVLEVKLGSKLPCDIDTFWTQAPWLDLMQSPTHKCQNFFNRVFNGEEQGYLSPKTPEEVQEKLDEELSQWKDYVRSKIDTITRLLRNLPPFSKTSKVEVVKFPATRFLQASGVNFGKDRNNPPQTVSAHEVFHYLNKEMNR